MNNFKDAEFMSAKEKELVLRDWIRFLKFLSSEEHENWNETNGGSDYGSEAPRVFTKRLYEHLSLHCGFIAHYNIHGFYSEYFAGNNEELSRFFNAINHYGDYKDLGDEMDLEFVKYKETIFTKSEEKDEDKFELLKELVKRAETDDDMKQKLIAAVF